MACCIPSEAGIGHMHWHSSEIFLPLVPAGGAFHTSSNAELRTKQGGAVDRISRAALLGAGPRTAVLARHVSALSDTSSTPRASACLLTADRSTVVPNLRLWWCVGLKSAFRRASIARSASRRGEQSWSKASRSNVW